ncbi:uncharacterized protein [Glycine max]|uniref:uncharacterized protein n=1 Tax=Glycine max TaxID=3847 RepID=UPI001B356CAA|nr:uncharacterized protein LOC106798225 [Glycine max]
MDRSWIKAPRISEVYQKGVDDFLQFAEQNAPLLAAKYFRPCVKCVNGRCLVNLKARFGLSDRSFTELLVLLKNMLPKDNILSKSHYEAKKILCPVGMEYQKIRACPNDCILYKNEFAEMHNCSTCGVSRYKINDEECSNGASTSNTRLAKVCWYLPILPRFKRLFASAYNAKNVRWHANGRIMDGLLRHPTDSPQWKTVDRLYPEFGEDPRNLRLGLASDGMNPFTGPKQSGNDIDVYLSPLIEDLRKLWVDRVDVYDANVQDTFRLRAMIFCAVNEFPPDGNLSGYSVKGHHACLICEKNTCYIQLTHGKKTIYTRHKRFLRPNHPYQRLKKAINEENEIQSAPQPLGGHDVYDWVKDIITIFGKTQKKDASAKNIWKKRSIFFDLPYLCDLHVRHFLDVMHVEKNMCDGLIGTLLNIMGKTKDGLKCHQDLVHLVIRDQLHPVSRGYYSNIKSLVSIKDLKLVGLKPHDCHVLMQQLLPVAIRGICPEKVRVSITRLCFFFNAIGSKVIDPQQLDNLENEASIILCELEMYSLPPPPHFLTS